MPFTQTRRFTRADFAEIRRLKYDEGWTQPQIARHYRVSRTLISSVLNLGYDEYYPAEPNRRPGAKLTEQDVMRMRELRRQGLTYPQIGAKFGVDKCTARLAVVGINWAAVPGAAA